MTSNLGNLGDGLKSVRQALTRAATADVTQRARTLLARDLPAWLAELGAEMGMDLGVDWGVAAPLDLDDVRGQLGAHLGQLARACGAERKILRAWHPFGGYRALSLKLSLDRVMGALILLEATLARSALALRRSDPRLAAIGAATAAAPGRAATSGGVTSGPLGVLTGRDARKLADRLSGALSEVVRAATNIQTALSGERAATPCDLAGAIEQTQTLAAWLRQECESAACGLLRRASCE